jgi:hypothetical protein
LYSGSGRTAGNNSSLLRNNAGTGGAAGNNDGSPGRLVVRYEGATQLCNGGTVTYDGTYTYHTFTSAGTLTVA